MFLIAVQFAIHEENYSFLRLHYLKDQVLDVSNVHSDLML